MRCTLWQEMLYGSACSQAQLQAPSVLVIDRPSSAGQLRLLLAAVLLRAAPAVARHDRRCGVGRASPLLLRRRCRLRGRGCRARPVR